MGISWISRKGGILEKRGMISLTNYDNIKLLQMDHLFWWYIFPLLWIGSLMKKHWKAYFHSDGEKLWLGLHKSDWSNWIGFYFIWKPKSPPKSKIFEVKRLIEFLQTKTLHIKKWLRKRLMQYLWRVLMLWGI